MEVLTDYKAKAKVLGFIRACDDLTIAKANKVSALLEAWVMSVVSVFIGVVLVIMTISPISEFYFGQTGKTICTLSIGILTGFCSSFALDSVAKARKAGREVSEAWNAYNEAYLEAWKVAV